MLKGRAVLMKAKLSEMMAHFHGDFLRTRSCCCFKEKRDKINWFEKNYKKKLCFSKSPPTKPNEHTQRIMQRVTDGKNDLAKNREEKLLLMGSPLKRMLHPTLIQKLTQFSKDENIINFYILCQNESK